nr:endonuclease/exonuclease/phosphatase family protein [Methylobacterium sp. Leaf89]
MTEVAPPLRLLSYNIRHGRGTDGRVDLERVARAIRSSHADIVALQEVDLGRARTGGVDQAQALARQLGLRAHFHAALQVETERYGDAILTRHPSRLIRAGGLPGLAGRPGLEPRGALWVEVACDGHRLQVLNTHLGLVAAEQKGQLAALLGPDWLAAASAAGPVVLAGDFNATPWSRAYRQLTAQLSDARAIARSRAGRATFPSRYPVLRLDHVFVGPGLRVDHVAVLRDGDARRASDHLPLLATLDFAAPPRAVRRPQDTPAAAPEA